MDPVSEKRLSEVHPELARRVRVLAGLLVVSNIIIRITQGLRTWNEQAALYAQGRETLAQVNDRRKAVGWAVIVAAENIHTVTNAAPGYSMHNYGLSIDFVPEDPTFPVFTPDWNTQHPSWKKILELALTVGLAEGAQWRRYPDAPHLYPKELPADPTMEMMQTFKDAGMMSVWKETGLPLVLPPPPVASTPAQ